MSLRESLRAAVARCVPIDMQRATNSHDHATGHATCAQQQPENPHEIRVASATATATTPRIGPEVDATFLGHDGAESRTQLHGSGSLLAHRVATQLVAAAMRRCDQFGDGEAARQSMREQCLGLPPHLRADLLDHFNNTPNHAKG
jgi:hypothetical protein